MISALPSSRIITGSSPSPSNASEEANYAQFGCVPLYGLFGVAVELLWGRAGADGSLLPSPRCAGRDLHVRLSNAALLSTFGDRPSGPRRLPHVILPSPIRGEPYPANRPIGGESAAARAAENQRC
jgi:hypothetical protein